MTTNNTAPQTQSSIDPETAHEAYEALKSRWLQRPQGERPRNSVFEAVSLGLEMGQQVQRDKELFRKLLPLLDVAFIDGFRSASLGLWAAETRWRTSRRRANQDDLDELMTQSQQARSELLAAADYIWRKDESVRTLLSDIRQGGGQRDVADDLQRLADLFRSRWDEAKGRSEIEESDVGGAAKLALKLLDQVLQDDQAEALDLRNKAWAHWYENYIELYAAGRYVHRHNPEQSTLYPSLSYQANRRRSGTQAAASPVTEAPTMDLPPTEGNTNETPTPNSQ